jgi:hypothetical protein
VQLNFSRNNQPCTEAKFRRHRSRADHKAARLSPTPLVFVSLSTNVRGLVILIVTQRALGEVCNEFCDRPLVLRLMIPDRLINHLRSSYTRMTTPSMLLSHAFILYQITNPKTISGQASEATSCSPTSRITEPQANESCLFRGSYLCHSFHLPSSCLFSPCLFSLSPPSRPKELPTCIQDTSRSTREYKDGHCESASPVYSAHHPNCRKGRRALRRQSI